MITIHWAHFGSLSKPLEISPTLLGFFHEHVRRHSPGLTPVIAVKTRVK